MISAPEEPLTVQKLCKLYGVHRTSVQRYVESGKLPRPFNLGRKQYWLPSVIAHHQTLLARRAIDAGRKAASRRRNGAAKNQSSSAPALDSCLS
jgi:predicted DNA-binding transcriptional regulator AlpA